MRRLVFLSFIISGLAFAQAKAQEMPAFAVPQIITADEIENLSVDFDESFNAIQNPYLSDTMKLNYQISLLDKLVTREAALTKIGESYTAIGMPRLPRRRRRAASVHNCRRTARALHRTRIFTASWLRNAKNITKKS